MSPITLPDDVRGPILDLELPASEDAIDLLLRNGTTGKSLAINLPAGYGGDDLTLDWYRRTITDQTGADRSALLDPEDNELWLEREPLQSGANEVEIEAIETDPTIKETSAHSPASVVDNSGVGTVAWSNPSNAKTSNDARATAALTAGKETHYLLATQFGFSLPANSRVVKASASVEGSATSGLAEDGHARLVKAGAPVGEDFAGHAWVAGDTVKSFGPFETAISQAELEATDFGFAFSMRLLTSSDTARVDWIGMYAWYVEPVAYAAKVALRWEKGYA